MNYQRVMIGVAIGTAVAGIAFLLFHPSGKKIRRKAVDVGLDAADRILDMLRVTHSTNNEPEPEAQVPGRQRRQTAYQPVTES